MPDTTAAEYGRRYWTLLYANFPVRSLDIEVDGDALAILRRVTAPRFILGFHRITTGKTLPHVLDRRTGRVAPFFFPETARYAMSEMSRDASLVSDWGWIDRAAVAS